MSENTRGIRSDHFRRAQHETDPGLRDLHLATAEMAAAGVLKAGRGHRYGRPTQDTRNIELTITSDPSQNRAMDETYWLADGFSLTKDYQAGHGWSTDVDPAAGV